MQPHLGAACAFDIGARSPASAAAAAAAVARERLALDGRQRAARQCRPLLAGEVDEPPVGHDAALDPSCEGQPGDGEVAVAARQLQEHGDAVLARIGDQRLDQQLVGPARGVVKALEVVARRDLAPARALSTTSVASSASAQAGISAAGSASAMLPPKVPRLRTATCATCGMASAISGRCWPRSANWRPRRGGPARRSAPGRRARYALERIEAG